MLMTMLLFDAARALLRFTAPALDIVEMMPAPEYQEYNDRPTCRTFNVNPYAAYFLFPKSTFCQTGDIFRRKT